MQYNETTTRVSRHVFLDEGDSKFSTTESYPIESETTVIGTRNLDDKLVHVAKIDDVKRAVRSFSLTLS